MADAWREQYALLAKLIADQLPYDSETRARRRVWRCGMPSPSSPGPAQPYSSRRRTWTRPSISPTG